MTALMWEAEWGHAENVRLLLKEAGRTDGNGHTALWHAVQKGHVDCV